MTHAVTAPHPEAAPTCIACNKPVRDGDAYYEDVNEGPMHAECCGPEPESFTGPDGEPLKPGDPIPAPGIYRGFEAPLSIAHTATAGDGGERTWHRDGALLFTLKPHVNQFGRLSGKMVNDVTVRVEGPDAETIASDIHARLAQAPAVQAPAGEDGPLPAQVSDLLSSVESVLDEMWNSHCKAHAMTTLVTEASEDISALRKLLAASPTPTYAQSKAARPVGDEAVRAVAEAINRARYVDEDGVARGLPYRTLEESGPTDRAYCTKLARAALASHSTTGQETVATPRDGGVREAFERWFAKTSIGNGDRGQAECGFMAGFAAAVGTQEGGR